MSTPMDPSAGLVKTNLPYTVNFVGRERELQEVLDALDSSTRAWIISLTGVGGIGKTELAIQAAHIAANNKLFEIIIWITAKNSWLMHEGIHRFKTEYPLVSLDDLLNTVIDVLEMDPRAYRFSLERKKELVKEILRTTSCLLVVDNLETVKDLSVTQFLEKLPPGPSKALVTTRLGGLRRHASEVVIALPLVGQSEIRIGPLKEEDAITLFLQNASVRGFQFSREEHGASLKKIVDKVAYIPLAIEWIIGQMALKNYDLDTALNQFNISNGEVLRYCFDTLIKAVPSRAKKVLLAISIFTESVSEEVLRDVTNIEPDYHKDALLRLYTASLVEYDKVKNRYSVLAPTRLYVPALQRELPDLYQEYSIEAARNYIRLLLNIEKQQQWLSFKEEQHNIMSLFSWCFDSGHFHEAIELAHPLSGYLDRLGLWDQRAYVCNLATLAASNLGDRFEAMVFTYDAAEIHKKRGRLDEALEDFQRCEEYSNSIGDKKKAAHAHMQIGIVLYNKGKYDDSIRALQQSLERHKANHDTQGVAQTFTILGRNELKRGHLHMAHEYFEEGLRLKQDPLGIAISKYDLGHFYHRLGNLQTAENFFKEALDTITGLGEKRHQANAEWYYALLQIDRGNLDAARSLLTDVVLIEKLLQRDKQFERANAKLTEVEKAAAAIQNTQGTRAIQSSTTENYADLATKVIAILVAYVSMGAEEFARKFSSAAYENARTLLSTLQERWSEDKEAADNLARFTEKPERYKPVVEDILQEKLTEDQHLTAELSRLLHQVESIS